MFNNMFSKTIKTTVVILGCFFQDAQGGYTREQLENYLGKPISSYVHLVNFNVTNQWLYTTQLSKILLVGDSSLFEFIESLPEVSFLAEIVNNRFSDTRFESFIKNVGTSSQQELQEAITDAILLSTASTQSYSTHKLLDCLIELLQNKIIIINNQIKHNFKYDQKSLHSMQKSLAWTAVLIASIALTHTYCSCDDKKAQKTVSNKEALHAFSVLLLLPASYKALKSCYKVLTTDPNAYNKHLEEFKRLLTFVQKLKTDLKKNGAISFRLANGHIATVKITDTFLGPDEGLVLDLNK